VFVTNTEFDFRSNFKYVGDADPGRPCILKLHKHWKGDQPLLVDDNKGRVGFPLALNPKIFEEDKPKEVKKEVKKEDNKENVSRTGRLINSISVDLMKTGYGLSRK